MTQKNILIGEYTKTHPFGDMYKNDIFEKIISQSNKKFQDILNMSLDVTEKLKDGNYQMEGRWLHQIVSYIITELAINGFDSLSQKSFDYQIGMKDAEITTELYCNDKNDKIVIIIKDNGMGKFADSTSKKEERQDEYGMYGGEGRAISSILSYQIIEKMGITLGENGATVKVIINPHRKEFNWEEIRDRKIRRKFET